MEMPDVIYAYVTNTGGKAWSEHNEKYRHNHTNDKEMYHHDRLVQPLRRENEELKAKLSETVIRLAARNSEIAELQAKHCDAMRQLDKAKDIIKDMENGDDAQACKEARKFIDSNAPEQP